MADLRELIDACVKAKAAFDAADVNNDEAEWNAFDEAEDAVITYPCRSLEDVRTKARFFLETESSYDTIRNSYTTTEDTLMSFLRSLLGEAPR